MKSLHGSGSILHYSKDKICIIETNVDDVSGEIIGHAIEELIAGGGFDASATPFTGKKGRPGYTIRITCARNSVKRLANILVKETGTLGLKVTDTDRWIVDRMERKLWIVIAGKSRPVRVKIASIDGQIRIKPEFEDAKQLASELHIPLRSILDVVHEQALRKLARG